MRYFLVLLLTAMLLPHVAKADIAPDNTHPINNCIGVENIANYPEYTFAWTITGFQNIESSRRITDAEPVCGASGTYVLFAIKKDNLDKITYSKDDPKAEGGNPAKQWIQDPRNADLFISSNYKIEFQGNVPDTNSTIKRLFSVHIDSATDAGVTAHIASTLSIDENGKETLSTAENPAEESLSPTAKILIAVGILGLGLAACSWKKK